MRAGLVLYRGKEPVLKGITVIIQRERVLEGVSALIKGKESVFVRAL